jgi:4-hydroxy-tetrahydrodipicolinate synthase
MSQDRFSNEFDRLYVAMVTPYRRDFTVDEQALRGLLKYFVQPAFKDAGGGIIINPAAGDTYYLSREEKRRNVEIAAEECKGQMPIFAGISALTPEQGAMVARDAKEAGADGLFLCPPMGLSDITLSWDANKYPEVWLDMARAEVDAVDLPAITHPNAPGSGPFGGGLPIDATLRMCKEIPNIVGWKMIYSYDSSILVAQALRSLDRHVGILSATAKVFHENLATGYFDGSVTGSFNYAMEPMIDHINAWERRDINEACRIWDSSLRDMQYYIYSEFSRLHVRYKVATWLRGLIDLPFMHPPVPKPRQQEVLTIREHLTHAGLSVIPEADMNRLLNNL